MAPLLDLPSGAGTPWRYPSHPWHGELVTPDTPKWSKYVEKWMECLYVIRTMEGNILAVSISGYQRTHHICLHITVYNNATGIISPPTVQVRIEQWLPSGAVSMQYMLMRIRTCWQAWLISCTQTTFRWPAWMAQTQPNGKYNYKKLDEVGDVHHLVPVLTSLNCSTSIKNNGDDKDGDHVRQRNNSFYIEQTYQQTWAPVNARSVNFA